MYVKVYHYDMTNRELVLTLSFDPNQEDVARAWAAGQYSYLRSFSISDEMKAMEGGLLEDIYRRTQDRLGHRSTSVGDVFIVGDGKIEQAWVVSTMGFKPVFLP